MSVWMETFWHAIIPGISNVVLGFNISPSSNLKSLFSTVLSTFLFREDK